MIQEGVHIFFYNCFTHSYTGFSLMIFIFFYKQCIIELHINLF